MHNNNFYLIDNNTKKIIYASYNINNILLFLKNKNIELYNNINNIDDLLNINKLDTNLNLKIEKFF